jgi:hypothetical protein
MKSFKLGNIEVMTHDYYMKERNKGTLHIRWKDYRSTMLDKFLRELKSDGWRVPTEKEAFYLLSLHKMGIGGFSNEWPPYCYYFIEPIISTRNNSQNPQVLNFHDGGILALDIESLGLLRLVRDI